ncbi:MAG: beta-ketoacyl-[acyl-carrier-protein] synthase family protein [Deltaproteobacteria bacterium]|nr:beta-ketoacyl-[acyl-carrier-protein] synthase family protein [Deltaproteobacteria bacterium]
MSRRIPVITGMGIVSPLGTGREAFASALLAGRSGVVARPAASGDPLPCKVHAPAQGFDPSRLPGQRKNLKLMTRAVAIGLGAAMQAMDDAGIAAGSVQPDRHGAYIGAPTALGEGRDLEPALQLATRNGTFDMDCFAREGLPLVNPLWLLRSLSNNVLGFVSAAFRMMGPNLNICNSGVGGLQAIGEAAQAIRDDRADVCLAGGYDSIVEAQPLALFARMGLLTSNPDPASASRPFHALRDGFVPAEGGAFLVVEEGERARKRGARCWGQLLGYATVNNAFDLASPGQDGRGIFEAASLALREAGVPPVEVGAVIAHSSGSVTYDPLEADVLRRLLGPARDRIPVSAPKSMIGHTVAASGAFGVATLLIALAERRIPPTLNLDDVAPGCALRHVRGEALPFTRRPHGLVLAGGLGGQHAALYLGEEPY